jgi:hypothetical protein
LFNSFILLDHLRLFRYNGINIDLFVTVYTIILFRIIGNYAVPLQYTVYMQIMQYLLPGANAGKNFGGVF